MSCHKDCNIYLNQELENTALIYALRNKDSKVTPLIDDAWGNYKKCIEQCNKSIQRTLPNS